MPGVTRLSVRNIRKSFGTHEVLRGISLDAEDGDVISLLGASGSGKSTFLRCINLLEVASDGEIWVDGEHIQMIHKNGKTKPASQKQVDHIRSELGMVFQSFNLFPHLTILENCTLAPIWVRKLARTEAEELAMSFLIWNGLGHSAKCGTVLCRRFYTCIISYPLGITQFYFSFYCLSYIYSRHL